MDPNKVSMIVAIVGIICFTGLISQCTHKVNECKIEAIKAGVPADRIITICKQ